MLRNAMKLKLTLAGFGLIILLGFSLLILRTDDFRSTSKTDSVVGGVRTVIGPYSKDFDV